MANKRGGSATPSISTSNSFELLDNNPLPGPATKRSRNISSAGGKFLLISHAESDKSFKNTGDCFIVSKALDGYSKEFNQVTMLRNGTLLIETANQRQTDMMLKATALHDIPIKVIEHPSLNSVRGTVYSYDLLNMSEEYILDNLKDQNVIKVERVKRFNDAKVLIETPKLILTFQGKIRPLTIKAGYLVLSVRTHYPMPLKCKTCQKFGHSHKRCRGQRLCASCGQTFHEGPCVELKCTNCVRHYPMLNNFAHRMNDSKCPKFLEEQHIVKIMVDNNLMYKDARVEFTKLYPKSSTSSTFAATVNSSAKPTPISKLRNTNNASIASSSTHSNQFKQTSQIILPNLQTLTPFTQSNATISKFPASATCNSVSLNANALSTSSNNNKPSTSQSQSFQNKKSSQINKHIQSNDNTSSEDENISDKLSGRSSSPLLGFNENDVLGESSL